MSGCNVRLLPGASPLAMTEIRECNESDLPSCSAILREVYSESPYKECWPEDRAREYLEAFFRIDPKGAFVATDHGMLLGALFGYTYPWHTGSVFFIQELFVSKNRRGAGIGHGLVTHALETKGRDSTVAVIVREGTDAAKFYEKLGLPKSEIYVLRSGKICA